MSIRQLARLANVSPSTVSLALSDSPKIGVATKRKIRQLAVSNHYRPDATVAELMTYLRLSRGSGRSQACLGCVSFYEHPRPWEDSPHLTRIYEGAQRRADELGYRLEPLWLRAPGMNSRRFSNILDARGIQGLLCFGSPEMEEPLPIEFDHYTIVTLGLSISAPLHRVTNHFYSDMIRALDRVHWLGYRRPGLVLGRSADVRSKYTFSSAYLGWCEYRCIPGSRPSVLRVDNVEERTVVDWLTRENPDVIVFAHAPEMIEPLRSVLTNNGRHIPSDLGVVVLTQLLEGTGFSGLQPDHTLIGIRAVDSLVARVSSRDFGLPTNPHMETLEGKWIEGQSLRRMLPLNQPL